MSIDGLSSASSSPASSLVSNDSSLGSTSRNTFQVEALLNNFRGLHDNDCNQSLATNSLFQPTIIRNFNYNDEIDLSLPIFKLLHHSNYEEVENLEHRFKFNTKLYGKHARFNNNFKIAYRSNLASTNAYVFIDKEILVDNSLCIQIVAVDTTSTDNNNNNNNHSNETSLAFGCTNCAIDKICQFDLPNDSYDLLNRQEYWIVNKNTLNNASVGDELCLSIDNSGKF